MNKVKLHIRCDEDYPVYFFEEDVGYYTPNVQVNISELAKFQRIMKEYEWLQNRLRELSRPARVKGALKHHRPYRCECGYEITFSAEFEKHGLVQLHSCPMCKKNKWKLALDLID